MLPVPGSASFLLLCGLRHAICVIEITLIGSLADKPRSKSGSTMAQRWRMTGQTHKKPRPPLNSKGLEQLALFYVGRYATTRAKLRGYLTRKVRERGWAEDTPAAVEALAEKFAELGYVDDAAFASSRAAALGRRGYGERRVEQALYAAGIEEADGVAARELATENAWDAALAFVRKRRVGPFAPELFDRDRKRKALAAMIRAGHPYDLARIFIDRDPGDVPERDD
jgi:regulatory protein